MIRAASWLATVALLTSSCAPRRVRWRPREVPASQRATSFAIVWAGARFHTAASREAPTVSLAPPRDPREPWAQDTFLTFRLLSERAGWATLETLGGDRAAHCTPERPALRALRLRVHVRSRALVRVTVREFTQSFEDGTSLELARGVPLEPLGGDLYRARLGALSTVVRLDPSAVGTRYLPSDPRAGGPTQGSLASAALRAGVPAIGQRGRVYSSARTDAPVWGVEPLDGERLVELRTRCGRLLSRVPADVVLPPDAPGSSDPQSEAAGDSPISPPYIAAGSPMFWPDGSDAGSTVERLRARDEVPAGGARRCFRRAVHRDSPARIVLCFGRAHVVDPEGSGSGLATPTD